MSQNTSQGTGPMTIVERSVRALAGGRPGGPSVRAATSLPRTLSWGAIRLGEEGVLPAALVTWPGHARTTSTSASASASGPIAVAAGRDPVTTDAAELGTVTARGRDTATAPGVAGLDGLPVGAGLVDVLAGIDVTATEDAMLLDVAARWQEVVSWAVAMQSRALGEIGRRRAWTEEHNAAAAEISARLRVPQAEANKHLARGAGLAEHPQVLHALQHGVIDVAKADILLRSGNPLTADERAEAITQYLPQAPDHTRRWLREKMNEFADELKGTKETTKHAAARRAVFLDPADNAMAWLSASLPAADAAAVWDTIEQAAHTLRRTPGATRTLAQARADALVAITTGRIIVPPHPECTPTTTNTGEADASEETGTNTGTNTNTSDNTAATGPEATTPTTEGPGTAAPVSDGSGPGGSPAAERDDPVLPRTTVPATGCTCGGCLCGGATVRVIPVKPQIRITIAATTLLGLNNLPGHLDGYGPIPADVAAQIANDATWQRLVTDPVTGILTDHSTTTYQPGKLLRAAVTARDRTCSFPHCDRPARWADLDHIHPFDHHLDPTTLPPGTPGQTRATNLQPLCRAHHLAKTHHGWAPVRDPATGITTWTAPTGHRYTRPATQVGHVSNDTTNLTDDTRHRLGQPPLSNGSATGDPTPTAGTITNGPPTNSPDEQLTTEQPTTEQKLRRFPEQPPF